MSVYDEVTQAIIAELEKGVQPWVKSWSSHIPFLCPVSPDTACPEGEGLGIGVKSARASGLLSESLQVNGAVLHGDVDRSGAASKHPLHMLAGEVSRTFALG